MKTLLQRSLFVFGLVLLFVCQTSTIHAQVQVDADGVGASDVAFLTKVGNKLFYYGINESNTNQLGLFTHDGTTPFFVKHLSSVGQVVNIKVMHDGYGKAYFHFNSVGGVMANGLVVSDGTDAGTIRLLECNNPDWFANALGKVFFSSALPGSNDKELYVTDGTVAGTFLVKDIHPGNTSSQVTKGVEFNNEYWFTARPTTQNGYHLFKSDGTTAGTNQLVYPTELVGHISSLFVHGGFLYFSGNTTNNTSALWRTDGTTAGTVKLFGGTNTVGTFKIMNSIGNLLLAFSSNIMVSPALYSLYTIDAVTLDTSLIKTGILNAANQPGWHYDNKIVFVGSSPTAGLEPWITDGTTAGTYMLADINPGTTSSNIFNSVAYSNNLLYLNIQSNGIWQTDGTIAGTSATGVQPDNNYALSFLSLNDEVYYLKDSPGRTRKIFRLGSASNIESITTNLNKMLAYPNPSNGMIHIKNENNQSVTLSVFNALGKKVYENKNNDLDIQINLSQQPKGLYFLNINSGNVVVTQKLIIQ